MASDIEVASNALRLIGHPGITSLSQDDDGARFMNAIFGQTRDEKLRSHAWNFAQRRVELAQLSTDPAFGYDVQYALPEEPYCLRVLETDLDDDEEWRIETWASDSSTSRVLVTDATSVNILYVARITDVNLWDQLFVDAMTYELAFRAAYALRRDAQLSQALQAEKEAMWAKARSVDGQEGRPLRSLRSKSLTDVR